MVLLVGERNGFMLEIIIDTILDGLKILPFLWVAFLLIELIEHKFYKQSTKIVERSGRLGPLLGGILGCFPQCGFSVMATNLYVTRIITLGTLISVYLSTSDEMLPILLARGSDINIILKLLLTKLIIGVICGFIIDLLFFKKSEPHIHELCEQEHCYCDKSIVLSSLKHTFHTLLFIILVSFLLNILMYYGGEEYLMSIFKENSWWSSFLASLIGLIPNCGASIILTELYLSEILSFSSVVAGLLTGSGVAILVLFKTNKNLKENIMILLLIYFIGSISGLLIELFSLL